MRPLLPLLLIVCFLQACTSYPAPIISLDPPPSSKITTHQVEKGDTLYSIAWRYDLTVDVLAKINQLDNSYMIKQGQILQLDPLTNPKQQSSSSTPKKMVEKAQAVGQKIVKMVKPSAPVTTAAKPPVTTHNSTWQYPVKGKIVEDFNPKQLRKGYVFEANGGSSVYPIGSGVVVYAGDGLRDYGKLVIIKHSDALLSAYGHNRKLLVREGQTVTTRETISQLGSEGRLYFEIRRDGKPVNPKHYLN